mmetsp:Transcript_23382/g.38697  ORF Transcript_23382/g.38697 Transcript_23382/m.38697 type:complete len:206 (-) Transcript_23382:549-1166(-)
MDCLRLCFIVYKSLGQGKDHTSRVFLCRSKSTHLDTIFWEQRSGRDETIVNQVVMWGTVIVHMWESRIIVTELWLPKVSEKGSPITIFQRLDARPLFRKDANNILFGRCQVARDQILQQGCKGIAGCQFERRKGFHHGVEVGNLDCATAHAVTRISSSQRTDRRFLRFQLGSPKMISKDNGPCGFVIDQDGGWNRLVRIHRMRVI